MSNTYPAMYKVIYTYSPLAYGSEWHCICCDGYVKALREAKGRRAKIYRGSTLCFPKMKLEGTIYCWPTW